MRNFTKLLVATAILCSISTTSALAQFKPEVNFGLLMQSFTQVQQEGYGSYTSTDYNSEYAYGIGVNHLRIMFDAKLTEKDYIFVETENNAIIGSNGDRSISMRVLDIMYEHRFSNAFKLSTGKILAAYNRNNIQSTATLLANDFGTFQCEWNGAMGNDAGRDIGINLAGNLSDDKVVYSIGGFLGHDFTEDEDVDLSEEYINNPIRFIGRLQYNFFDADQYAGTTLGEGKTLSVGVGFDTQGAYVNGGIDAYLDMPVGEKGSLTVNLAYASMTGGDETDKYYVADIPAKDVYFAEVGYYFKELKLQPWVKYELMSEKDSGIDDAIYGGGVSYYFNGHNTNIKLAYTSRENSVLNKSYNQITLALHLFIF